MRPAPGFRPDVIRQHHAWHDHSIALAWGFVVAAMVTLNGGGPAPYIEPYLSAASEASLGDGPTHALVAGFVNATGVLTTARAGHTATLLPNGSVLIVRGGTNNALPPPA